MSTNAYDAYVSADGKADYLLPSAALNAGKKNIYVQPGVYLETTNLTLSEGASITGAQRGTTIIDFQSNNARVVCAPASAAITNTGTISIATNSATVTGTGTNFLSIPSTTQYLIINGRCFPIASVADDVTLTLRNTYRGNAVVDATYSAQSLQSFNEMKNITIRNSALSGLYVASCRRARFSNVGVESCTESNVYISNSYESSFVNVDSDFSTQHGFAITNCATVHFDISSAMNNVQDGFYSDLACSYLFFDKINACNNGGANLNIAGDSVALSSIVACRAAQNGCVLNGNTCKFVCGALTMNGYNNLYISDTANNTLLGIMNFNNAGWSEFNNASSSTMYALTYP